MQIRSSQHEGAYTIKITAEESGAVLGWALLVVIPNERHAEPYGVMENVYVEKEHRGKGIGTELIKALIEEAKAQHCYKLIAWSRHSKPQVHALYKKHGFTDWGVEFRMDLQESEPLQRD